MRQASVVCGGGDGGVDVWWHTGDLKEVNNKQFLDDTSSESLFPRWLWDTMTMNNDDEWWAMSMYNEQWWSPSLAAYPLEGFP
jgi:hypothetical protein